MKLVIVKGVYPDIDILDDEITLGVEDFSDYYKLLNDESLRETFYERYDDLGLYDSFLDYRAIRELPFGIDLDYFEETRLIVNDNSMGEDLKIFCESNSFPVLAFLFSKDNERDIIMSMKELQSISDNVPDKIQYDAKRMELVNVLRKGMAKKK